MKSYYRMLKRVNLVSLLFVIVSFISVTLAWFAYSGLGKVATEIDVKAWFIELEKNGESVSNDISISLEELYPGMKTVTEEIKIKNLGDSDASVNYSIVSARILGEEKDNYLITENELTSEEVEDILSHQYPFKININLSRHYVLSKNGESIFKVSVSWPLDSDDDELDSKWGNDAYNFYQKELKQQKNNPNYQIRPAIQIVLSVVAEQYIKESKTSDVRYNLGDVILYDVEEKKVCPTLSETCLKTYVIDVNNTLGDNFVSLLLDPKGSYIQGDYYNYTSLYDALTRDWEVTSRALVVEDLLKIISTDVVASFLVREDLSNTIIGNLKYENRMSSFLDKTVLFNGYYYFKNNKFNFLIPDNCYWTNSNYNDDYGYGVVKYNEKRTKIYAEEKEKICQVIPVIEVEKADLN
ncbi:MAG: hypothetical protein ACOXZR_02295 [Bacilli bacterium]|jgi:hypothetical protein